MPKVSGNPFLSSKECWQGECGIRAVTKAFIGGGGAYSYIRVLPDEFLLKSTVMTTEIRRAEREYMNIPPPPQINALVTAPCGIIPG